MTPENKTYTGPMSGYYPGSIGFEDDLIGTIPNDWWYFNPDGGSFYRVVSEWQGHNNVYEIRKHGGTQKVSTSVNFSSPATAGSVDFWLYKDTDSNIDPSRINLEDGYELDYFTFGFDEGTFYTGTWQDKQQIFPNAFSKNQWHYVRVDFDLSIGWQVQIDNKIYGEGYAFKTYVGSPTQVLNFQIESIWSGCNPNYGTWVDSIGYSWDPNYDLGDNLLEGLLISYSAPANLDWQAYSLDGQANITISGNTTIPMSSNGVHSIKIVGVDSFDNTYESELRVFSINYQPPPPNNPNHDQLLILLFTLIGVVFALGLTLAVYFLVIKPSRKIPSKSFYNSPPKIEKSYPKGPMRENLQSNGTLIQCPHCFQWNEPGGNYCANCGGKL